MKNSMEQVDFDNRVQEVPKPYLQPRSFAGDFVCISEFSEDEGPVPILIIPEKGEGSFDIANFVIKIMAVDYQSKSVSEFTQNEDTQAVLQEGPDVFVYVHHVTMLDIDARGYIRQICLSYITHDALKINLNFPSFLKTFSEVSRLLKEGNRGLFETDIRHRLADLEYTRQEVSKQLPTSTQGSKEKDVQGQSFDEQTDSSSLSALAEVISHLRSVQSRLNLQTDPYDVDAGQQVKEEISADLEERDGAACTKAASLPATVNSGRTAGRASSSRLLLEEAAAKRAVDGTTETATVAVVEPEEEEEDPVDPEDASPLPTRLARSNPCPSIMMTSTSSFNPSAITTTTATTLASELDAAPDDSTSASLHSSSPPLKPNSTYSVPRENYQPKLVHQVYKCSGAVQEKLRPISQISGAYYEDAIELLTSTWNKFRRPQLLLKLDEDDAKQTQPAPLSLRIGFLPMLNFHWYTHQEDAVAHSSHISMRLRYDTSLSCSPSSLEESSFATPVSSPPKTYYGADMTALTKNLARLSTNKADVVMPSQTSWQASELQPIPKTPSLADIVWGGQEQEQVYPGQGLLAVYHTHDKFLTHIVFSILKGRPLIIVGAPSNEYVVRDLILALSFFVPSPTHKAPETRIVPWRTTPLKLADLAHLKLVGLARLGGSQPSTLPKCVERYSSVWDVQAGVLRAPRYANGAFVDALLCTKKWKDWPDEACYLAYLNMKLTEMGMKAALYYHLCCMNAPTPELVEDSSTDDEEALPRSKSSDFYPQLQPRPAPRRSSLSLGKVNIVPRLREQSKAAFFAKIGCSRDDSQIVEHLAEIIQQQQTATIQPSRETAPVIRLDYTPCTTFNSKKSTNEFLSSVRNSSSSVRSRTSSLLSSMKPLPDTVRING